MLEVDTNVVVRFLADDDAAQHKRALALFDQHAIWLPKTVMLESEWVLRSAFGFEAAESRRRFVRCWACRACIARMHLR